MRTQEDIVAALNFVADSVRAALGIDVLTRFCVTSETLFIETDAVHMMPFIRAHVRVLAATHDRGKLAPLSGCAVDVAVTTRNSNRSMAMAHALKEMHRHDAAVFAEDFSRALVGAQLNTASPHIQGALDLIRFAGIDAPRAVGTALMSAKRGELLDIAWREDEPEAPTVRAIAAVGDYVVVNGVVGRVKHVADLDITYCGNTIREQRLTCETERVGYFGRSTLFYTILPAGHPVPFATVAQSVRLSATLAHREALKAAPAWARDFERPKHAYVAAIGKIAADWVESAKTLLTTVDLVARAAEAMGVKPPESANPT